MAGINSQNQIGHVALESTFGTAVAPSNSDAFKSISLVADPTQEERQRQDKNPSLSQTVGIGGNRSGTWSMRANLPGSSAAGTAPDIGGHRSIPASGIWQSADRRRSYVG
jgi:hypothetical protein